jgi:hypothetical protein
MSAAYRVIGILLERWGPAWSPVLILGTNGKPAKGHSHEFTIALLVHCSVMVV